MANDNNNRIGVSHYTLSTQRGAKHKQRTSYNYIHLVSHKHPVVGEN